MKIENISEPVISLAKDMQFKLNKNKFKPCDNLNTDGKGRNWEDCNFYWLVTRIQDEIDELIEEFEKGDYKESRLECADIANFAMMIHDNLNALIGDSRPSDTTGD